MHNNLDLLITLTSGLAAALVLGYLTQRLGLSPLVGYLLAGVAVSPNTPGFAANRELAEQLAEIGVILLMFGVGLHFHLKELLAVRRIAVPGAVVQSVVATLVGAVIAWALGWGWAAGVVYGLALSVASTVVLTRVLVDNHELHTPTGHIAMGWLVVEDLFTVVVLVLLPVLFGGPAAGPEGLALAFGLAAVKILALVALTFLVGGRLIPWLLARVEATRSRELFTLTVLVIALGIAVGSAKLFGVSMALGAFLAGMVVGRSDFSLRAATDALPMRDAFAVLFFVSVGMLFDARQLIEAPGLVVATLAVILLAKPLAALGIVLLLGYPVRVGIAVAVALSQIGEFSFILADLGHDLGILPDAIANALITAAMISIALNPLLYRLVDPLEAWAAKQPRLWAWLNRRKRAASVSAPGTAGEAALEPRYRAVIVGYGPVGRTVARLLRDNGIQPTVVELNLETVQRMRREDIPAVYGDANHRETLQAAGIDRAATLILTSSGMHHAEEIIRQAHDLNPQIHVLARCAYLSERPALRKVGADGIFASEAEVALAMTESLLRFLGAVPEQIDRERERVRADLSEDTPLVADARTAAPVTARIPVGGEPAVPSDPPA